VSYLTIGLSAAGCVLLALYAITPGVFLRLGLLLYPKGHERRRELNAERHYMKGRARYRWIASALVLCLCDGSRMRFNQVSRNSIRSVVALDLPNKRVFLAQKDATILFKYDPELSKALNVRVLNMSEMSRKDRRHVMISLKETRVLRG